MHFPSRKPRFSLSLSQSGKEQAKQQEQEEKEEEGACDLIS